MVRHEERLRENGKRYGFQEVADVLSGCLLKYERRRSFRKKRLMEGALFCGLVVTIIEEFAVSDGVCNAIDDHVAWTGVKRGY